MKLAPRRKKLALFAFAAALFAPLASASDLLVVDPQGLPGTYANIEAAVQAASDGDVILVREGIYLSFYVDNKALTIVAAPNAWVRLTAGPRVVNLAADKRVVLSGLHVEGSAHTFLMAGNGLNLIGNAGQIVVQDCVLIGANNLSKPANCNGIGDNSGWQGAVLTDSANVVFANSSLTGGRGTHLDTLPCMDPFFHHAGVGGHGVHLINSSAVFYNCIIEAGPGGGAAKGGLGGHGLRAEGAGSFALYGTQVNGGQGGHSLDWTPLSGGNGGHGVFRTPQGGTFTTLDSSLAGGAPGWGSLGAASGSPGATVWGTASIGYPAIARYFTFAAPVAEGGVAQLAIWGEPGDLVLLLAGGPVTSLPLPDFQGVLHLLQPGLIWPLGTLNSLGAGSFGLPVGSLPPGLQGLSLPLQSAFVTGALEILLGPPRDLILVASTGP